MDSYLSNRKQCVKIGSVCSLFSEIYKGVPQGSILAPVLFKTFINDIFCFISKSSWYNYADDNTLSYSDTDINISSEEAQKAAMAMQESASNDDSEIEKLADAFFDSEDKTEE